MGIGYLGEGNYKSGNKDKINKNYSCWRSLIVRCYDEKYHNKFPSYKNCTVYEEWHNFQKFAKWYEENYIEGWELDKDIIIKSNKIYSPETCAFVPKEINYLFTNRKNHRNGLPLGVSKIKNRYRATSTQNKKHISYGYYITPEEAFYAYKEGKENYIKEVAEEWKPLIDERVYNAMMNWKIEITD